MPLAAFPKCFLHALCVARTMTPEEWIDLAATYLEVDGLELYWGFLPHDSPQALQPLRRKAERRGLRIAMLCYSPDFTQPDREAWRAEVERAKWAVEVAARLGAETCRVLSGQARPGLDVPMGLSLAAQAITELLPTAERFQVKLALENHYKDGFWQYPELAWQQERFLELLSLIPPSPWFGVNYDPSNALLAGDDPIVLLEQVKHRVISMHASDRYLEGGSLAELRRMAYSPQQGYAPFLRHGVVGQGMNDYDKIFSLLSSVGFQGWISIEDGEDAERGIEHLQRSAQFLRAKMAEYHLA
ncbi:sugar phosphate isomerase/epimerase [Chthonomonas calidirosea]|uniref:sugar phosphate isomerase/epimerase family protein n=1 Tax=Chthonomonas calidirosea TaxID=454171 RepID=UPI0006DD3D02|nr:sugar phosphate isomerase/epimerase family protein [Chthonomonas calidirosea]CEK12678.1 sugar phosphate isomerase/epimerase [Chthonomonas calidirosea]